MTNEQIDRGIAACKDMYERHTEPVWLGLIVIFEAMKEPEEEPFTNKRRKSIQ